MRRNGEKQLWIPALRFVHLLDGCGIKNEDLSPAHVRRMFDLRNGRQDFISLDAADRILTRLGLGHLFHDRKEDGGLADIYVDEAQYGKPDYVRDTKPPAPRRIYATHEEKLAARRASYRAYNQRRLATGGSTA